MRLWIIPLLCFCLLVTSCARQAATQNLYQDLGQKAGITNIVDELILNISQDELIRPRFKDVDIVLFRQRLIEHFCELSGGPCDYSGGEMAEVHKGLDINDAEFNRLVELLRAAMNNHGVSYQAQNEMLSILAPMHSDVTYQ